eukprot:TCONS_00002756-protein
MSNPETIASVTILSLLMLTSLLGNGLTIIATLTNQKLRSITGLLICNLAVSDLLISGINLPIRICQYFGINWSAGGISECRVSVAMTLFLFTASNTNLLLITADRYLGVTKPIKYRQKMNIKILRVVIAIGWFYSFIISVFPYFIVGGKTDANDSVAVCTFQTVFTPAYILFIEFGTFFVPFFVMVGMYIKIIHKLVAPTRIGIGSDNTNRNSVARCTHKEHRRKSVGGKTMTYRQEKKLAKGVFVILSVYSISLIPIVIMEIIDVINQSPIIPLIAIKIAITIVYLNAAVNTPIYALSSEKHREAFAKLLRIRAIDRERRRTEAKLSSNIGLSSASNGSAAPPVQRIEVKEQSNDLV